jgi:hypothetical protein
MAKKTRPGRRRVRRVRPSRRPAAKGTATSTLPRVTAALDRLARARARELTNRHALADRAAKTSPKERQLARLMARTVTRELPGARELLDEVVTARTATRFGELFKASVWDIVSPVFKVRDRLKALPGAPKRLPNPFFQAIGLAEGRLKGQLLGAEEHVFGEIPYNEDDRKLGSALWITHFITEASASNPFSGRFISHPLVEVSGSIVGWTGIYNVFLAADDKWCKCRLHLRQTVVQPAFGGLIQLGEATDMRVLLDEENNGGAATAHLPGLIRMPAVSFEPVNSALSVLYIQEVRFEVELEGDSGLWFGPSATSPINSPFVNPLPTPLIPF